MSKRANCLVFAAFFLLLSACGAPEASSSSESVPAQTFEIVQEPEPASPLPPLDENISVADQAGMDEAPQNWWFGGDKDEQNRPVYCLSQQEEYGNRGLVAFGPEEQAVYLTFDLGYEPGYTAGMLDTLKEKEVKATFFLVSYYLDAESGLVRRMIAEGHSVGGHSDTHPGEPGGLAGLGAENQLHEIEAVAQRLRLEFDYESRLFRFPAGIYSVAGLTRAASLGQYSVFWTYGYVDWDGASQPDPDASLQAALDAAHPGAIYLLHPLETNAAILGDLIDGLQNLGYEIKPL